MIDRATVTDWLTNRAALITGRGDVSTIPHMTMYELSQSYIAALDALEKYAMHSDDCECNEPWKCTCGLDEIRKEIGT